MSYEHPMHLNLRRSLAIFASALPLVFGSSVCAAEMPSLPTTGSAQMRLALSGDSLHIQLLGETHILQIRDVMAPVPAASRVAYGQPGAQSARLELARFCGDADEGVIEYENPEWQDGRITADVRCGGVNVATYMLENGYLWALPDAPAAYRSLQEYAHNRKAGIWKHEGVAAPIPPWEWKQQTPEAVERFKRQLELNGGYAQ